MFPLIVSLPAILKLPALVKELFALKKVMRPEPELIKMFPVVEPPSVKVFIAVVVTCPAPVLKDKDPDTDAAPFTSRGAVGEVVLIPTFPFVPPTLKVVEFAIMSNLFVPVEFNDGLVPERVKVVPAKVRLPVEVRTLFEL